MKDKYKKKQLEDLRNASNWTFQNGLMVSDIFDRCTVCGEVRTFKENVWEEMEEVVCKDCENKGMGK